MKLFLLAAILMCVFGQEKAEVISVKAKLFKEEAFYPYFGVVTIEGHYFFQMKDAASVIKYNDVFEVEVMCPREVIKAELLKDSIYLISINISDRNNIKLLEVAPINH